MGADAIGIVVFSPASPRNVSLPEAKKILAGLGPGTCGVLVSHTRSERDFADMIRLKPSAVQVSHHFLSGERDDVKLIRVIRPGDNLPHDCDAVVVDESLGSGRHYNPEFAKNAVKNSTVPVILAGGLHPGNVKDAIMEIRPYAVDVASGVESTPGIKDPRLVRDFIAASKE
jgi:phosphoribosylanthranilate isomerase